MPNHEKNGDTANPVILFGIEAFDLYDVNRNSVVNIEDLILILNNIVW